MSRPKSINGYPIVKRESDAICVYDIDAGEVVAYAPGVPWPISKSKWMREHGTGNRCVYLGWPKEQEN